MWPRACSRTGGKYNSRWWKVHSSDRGSWKLSSASAGLASVEPYGEGPVSRNIGDRYLENRTCSNHLTDVGIGHRRRYRSRCECYHWKQYILKKYQYWCWYQDWYRPQCERPISESTLVFSIGIFHVKIKPHKKNMCNVKYKSTLVPVCTRDFLGRLFRNERPVIYIRWSGKGAKFLWA